MGTQAPPTQPGILESARKERDLVDVITLRGYAHESLYLLLGIKYGYACVRRWWLESVQSGQPGGTDLERSSLQELGTNGGGPLGLCVMCPPVDGGLFGGCGPTCGGGCLTCGLGVDFVH